MADVGNIKVDIVADIKNFKAGLNTASSGLAKFGTNTANFVRQHQLAFAAAATAIVAFAVKSLKAYAEEEKAIATLTQALKNQGVTSKVAIQEQLDFAAAMQKTTTYGDEEVVGLQALLAQYGATGDKLKETTQLTLDLAAAKGIDLKAAADLVGKAFVGETGTLSRYGIILEEGIPRSQKFAAASKKMAEMFGGQAQAQRNTTIGQLAFLKNRFGDLQEVLGKELLPVLKSWMGWMDTGIGIVEKFIKAKNKDLSISEIAIKKLKEERKELVDNLQSWQSRIFMSEQSRSKTSERIIMITRQIEVLRKQIETEKLAGQQSVDTANITVSASEDMYGTLGEIHDAHIEKWGEQKEKQAEKQEKFRDSMMWTTKAWSDFAQGQVNAVTVQFGDGMADMILEGKKFSDTIKGIWKSLSNAIISMITQMIVKWILWQAITGGQFGTPLGTFFFGMQHGGIIGEPSIIKGLVSGRMAMAGEAGPEAVVPMKNQRSSGGLRPANTGTISASGGPETGGSNITINISGLFLEANELAWRTMFQNKLMPEIRRATMINPTGPFNRKRGAA